MFGGEGAYRRWAAAIIGWLLLGAAAVLLTKGYLTPRYTDAQAYQMALDALSRDNYGGVIRHEAAIDAFYDLEERFGTRRWLYVDLGWSVFVSGVLTVGVSLLRLAGGRLTTREPAFVLPAAAVTVGLFFVGLAAGPVLLLQREQLPMWSDTVGIPIFGAMVVTAIVAPVLTLLALPPLYIGRQPRGLFRSGRGWVATIVVTAVYLPPLACAAFLLSGVAEPGGWLLTLSALSMIWLLINARAHWLGGKPHPPLP